jgi:hypothetical protein
MRKRGNGEGSIARRKDGLYMARYTIQTTTGSKRKAVYGKTRKEVSEKDDSGDSRSIKGDHGRRWPKDPRDVPD